MKLIFEQSVKQRRGFVCPGSDVPSQGRIPKHYRRNDPCPWPEVSEPDVVRHFTCLSQLNYSLDTQFYPLGSCTMKYNPRFCEQLAATFGMKDLHPMLAQLNKGEQFTQGALRILYHMDHLLSEITGMDGFTLQPMAGAHGELTGVMLMAAYHRKKKNKKTVIIVPDSAHGTNPASAAIAGYKIVSIPTGPDGLMDLKKLKEQMSEGVAGLMLTCPNTLGLFNPQIDQIAQMIHDVDGLMYYDGANLNALLGRARPGDLGFDIVHVNLHKTFSTPHGGGGPGAGPVGVKEKLVPFLPISRVEKKKDGTIFLNYDHSDSIGYIASLYGNFAVILKAYAYILFCGKTGLKQISDHAVLNANYILCALKKYYDISFKDKCMHECVLSAASLVKKGVHALDIAKFLIDQGIHPPTIYFPLIVKEAMMIEPTETENKETLDQFIKAMIEGYQWAHDHPEDFKTMPRSTGVSRPDEALAARQPNCNYFYSNQNSR